MSTILLVQWNLKKSNEAALFRFKYFDNVKTFRQCMTSLQYCAAFKGVTIQEHEFAEWKGISFFQSDSNDQQGFREPRITFSSCLELTHMNSDRSSLSKFASFHMQSLYAFLLSKSSLKRQGNIWETLRYLNQKEIYAYEIFQVLLYNERVIQQQIQSHTQLLEYLIYTK